MIVIVILLSQTKRKNKKIYLIEMIQLDLTNAYLHAPIQDLVYIYIPDGFPGAGEIALLQKAAYGTKQGARRFYDFTIQVFKQIPKKLFER